VCTCILAIAYIFIIYYIRTAARRMGKKFRRRRPVPRPKPWSPPPPLEKKICLLRARAGSSKVKRDAWCSNRCICRYTSREDFGCPDRGRIIIIYTRVCTSPPAPYIIIYITLLYSGRPSFIIHYTHSLSCFSFIQTHTRTPPLLLQRVLHIISYIHQARIHIYT